MNMKTMEWKKPTISFFKEKSDKQEPEPFVVIKAQKISLKKTEKHGYDGEIIDFFVLMGDIDYINSDEGIRNKYVLCWFDDSVDDFNESFRRLTGVSFPEGIKCKLDKRGKKICKSNFIAKDAKLK